MKIALFLSLVLLGNLAHADVECTAKVGETAIAQKIPLSEDHGKTKKYSLWLGNVWFTVLEGAKSRSPLEVMIQKGPSESSEGRMTWAGFGSDGAIMQTKINASAELATVECGAIH